MMYALMDQWQKKASINRLPAIKDQLTGILCAKQYVAPSLYPITVQLKAEFAVSRQSYGSRRLVAAFKAKSIQIGRYKVHRLMRQAHIRPVWKRKFISTTNSQHDLPIADNLLNRQFNYCAVQQMARG
jgi:transposase InsO family protein